MGAIIPGPRIGKYGADGKPRAIPGHNIAFVILGAMILFVGWFGFNPGSELAVDEFVMQVGVKTLLAGCSGAVIAMIVNWSWDGKPDVSMAANGLLAGRSEEHTSELQSLMRISYAVFCLKKKKPKGQLT